MKRILHLRCILLAAALIFGVSAIAAAQMALDLDPAPGDQKVREAQVKPGDMKTIELVATKGATGIIGFEVELKLDARQVVFKSFQATGLMAGAMAMPPQRTAEGVKISVAIMGGSTGPNDAGTLGQILVEFARDLGAETAIELVKGSYGSAAGTQAFPLEGGVKFTSGKAPKAAPPSPIPPPPPPPPAGEPPGPSGQGVEDPNEPNIPDGKDFKALAVDVQGDDVRVQINTYADWAFRPFQSLYFKGGEKGQLHVLLMGDQFAINGETPGKKGLFTVQLLQGKGEIKGSEYILKFPWTVAFGNSTEVEAWVFSQDGRDRIPDGNAALKVQRGAATAGMLPSSTPPSTGKPAASLEPPECDENVRNSELKPQAENEPCGGSAGNLLFRTVCNKTPYDQAAITLPGGRTAGCFGVESITNNKVVWGIRVEGGPDIYHSSKGPAALNLLKISDTQPSSRGKYTIFLDMKQSDPNARVTVRFVDHPKGGASAGLPAPGGKPGIPPGGPPPSPQEMIKSLPSALQTSFRRTLIAEKLSIESKLQALKSARQTLEDTKGYLPRAGEAEKAAVAEALMFFRRGPEGPPPESPGAPPPAMMKPAVPPESVEAMVQQMIEEIDREIARLQEELKMLAQ